MLFKKILHKEHLIFLKKFSLILGLVLSKAERSNPQEKPQAPQNPDIVPWIVDGQETGLFIVKGVNNTGIMMIYDPEIGGYRRLNSKELDELDNLLNKINESRNKDKPKK